MSETSLQEWSQKGTARALNKWTRDVDCWKWCLKTCSVVSDDCDDGYLYFKHNTCPVLESGSPPCVQCPKRWSTIGHDPSSSGMAGQFTARNAKPPCSVFQLVLSKFEARSKIAKAPSDKHCMAHLAPYPISLSSPDETSHLNSEVTSHTHGMRARGARFLVSPNEASHPNSEVTSHTRDESTWRQISCFT